MLQVVGGFIVLASLITAVLGLVADGLVPFQKGIVCGMAINSIAFGLICIAIDNISTQITRIARRFVPYSPDENQETPAELASKAVYPCPYCQRNVRSLVDESEYQNSRKCSNCERWFEYPESKSRPRRTLGKPEID